MVLWQEFFAKFPIWAKAFYAGSSCELLLVISTQGIPFTFKYTPLVRICTLWMEKIFELCQTMEILSWRMNRPVGNQLATWRLTVWRLFLANINALLNVTLKKCAFHWKRVLTHLVLVDALFQLSYGRVALLDNCMVSHCIPVYQ